MSKEAGNEYDVIVIGAGIGGLVCAIQIFQTLNEVYRYTKFEKFSRGKRLGLQQASSLLTHVLG